MAKLTIQKTTEADEIIRSIYGDIDKSKSESANGALVDMNKVYKKLIKLFENASKTR